MHLLGFYNCFSIGLVQKSSVFRRSRYGSDLHGAIGESAHFRVFLMFCAYPVLSYLICNVILSDLSKSCGHVAHLSCVDSLIASEIQQLESHPLEGKFRLFLLMLNYMRLQKIDLFLERW